jgi:hypothetical protein
MNIQFSIYFTHEEVADIKELLKDTEISVTTLEAHSDENIVKTIIFIQNDYDFQRFSNALIRAGVQKCLSKKLTI